MGHPVYISDQLSSRNGAVTGRFGVFIVLKTDTNMQNGMDSREMGETGDRGCGRGRGCGAVGTITSLHNPTDPLIKEEM